MQAQTCRDMKASLSHSPLRSLSPIEAARELQPSMLVTPSPHSRAALYYASTSKSHYEDPTVIEMSDNTPCMKTDTRLSIYATPFLTSHLVTHVSPATAHAEEDNK
uniref:Uncharacterized protein n=1 Tax=Lygus hesperus TaxID=30085 RepID=A0A146KPE7_LYGHE